MRAITKEMVAQRANSAGVGLEVAARQLTRERAFENFIVALTQVKDPAVAEALASLHEFFSTP